MEKQTSSPQSKLLNCHWNIVWTKTRDRESLYSLVIPLKKIRQHVKSLESDWKETTLISMLSTLPTQIMYQNSKHLLMRQTIVIKAISLMFLLVLQWSLMLYSLHQFSMEMMLVELEACQLMEVVEWSTMLLLVVSQELEVSSLNMEVWTLS